MNKKVQVLLSTYNGEKYLVEQIESILAQKYSNLDLLIRDDSSTDSTLSILEKYANSPRVKIVKEKNRGVPQCFFRLLEIASPQADYFAFCDQDDVWLNDKITRAIAFLEEILDDIPSMYCSRLNLVDENLNFLGTSFLPKQEPSFKNAIVSNMATGCTVVINKRTRELILKQTPRIKTMHDRWIYQVVSALGKVVVDRESRILYRQHQTNSVGMSHNLLNRWLRRINQLTDKDSKYRSMTTHAQELLAIYGDMLSEDNFKILSKFIYSRKTIVARLKYALQGEVRCQSLFDDLALRLLIIANLI